MPAGRWVILIRRVQRPRLEQGSQNTRIHRTSRDEITDPTNEIPRRSSHLPDVLEDLSSPRTARS